MSIHLTEEQELISNSALEFAREYLEPIAVELDHSGAYPADLVKRMAEQDFMGLFLPAEFGGAEAGYVSFVQVIENLSRSCSAAASILTNHSLAAYAIQRWGSAAQKKQYLPLLASGKSLGAFAICENGPTLGVGPNALMAVKKPNGWVLNGTKAYVRNATCADVYVALSCSDANNAAMTAFIVGAKVDGLTIGEPKETMGLKGCPVADLAFKDVIVTDSDLLGTENAGAALATETLAFSSLAAAAQTAGIAQTAVEHAAAYSKTRVQFGRPICTLQAIQALLAETATDCMMARLGVHHAAQLMDSGEPFQIEAAMVKQFAARVGSKMLVDSVQVEGGFGYSEFMPLARLFRDIAGTTLLDAPADFPEATIAGALLA